MTISDFLSSIKLGVTADYEKNILALIDKYQLYIMMSSAETFYGEMISHKFCFNDDKYKSQVKMESWESIDRNAFRLRTTKHVIDNIFEGEQISLIW